MKILLTYIFLLFGLSAAAHGDLHTRIKKVSKQIEKNPNDPSLYIKRGDLYHQHEEYKRALLDFERARALGHDSDELTVLFAKSYFGAKKYTFALNELSDILASSENHVVANRLTGEVYAEKGELNLAAEHLQRALDYSDKRIPQHYIDLSKIYLEMEKTSSLSLASNVLENGIDDLGELIVFLQELVSIHRINKDYDQAINWQNRIVAISKRKERPLYHRAEIHYLKGDYANARQDLEDAQEAIEKLPRRISRSNEMQKILNGINMMQYEMQGRR